MKVIITGASGMLGNYLNKFLSQKFKTLPLTREDIDFTSGKKETISYFSRITEENDVIINAAGLIKQRNVTREQMILVNSLLPNYLNEIKLEKNCKIIHITTDCIFSGKEGNYDENSKLDVTDDYGITKYLGENQGNMNIRTSIIGEENFNKKSLIEWCKSNKLGNVSGYENHLWNGVTCLELSEMIYRIIDTNNFWTGTRHIFSPEIVSKFELIHLISEIYDLNLKITKSRTEQDCFRNLNTIYKNSIKKSLRDQIIEQKKFNIIEYNDYNQTTR